MGFFYAPSLLCSSFVEVCISVGILIFLTKISTVPLKIKLSGSQMCHVVTVVP